VAPGRGAGRAGFTGLGTGLHKPAHAATLTVTNLNDSGAGSLRDRVAAASPGETISFSVTGTITLTKGEIILDKNLSIAGPGAGSVSISGNNSSRVFSVSNNSTVSISGVTVKNGRNAGANGSPGSTPPGGGGGGGAGLGGNIVVASGSSLTINSSVIASGEARGGNGANGG